MAMEPGMMDQGAAAGAPEAPEEAGAEQEQGGYCIEIHIGADGQISIGVETEAEEDAEHEATGQEPERTPVKGIREAMEVVLDIFKSGGQMAEANDQFAEGFGAPPKAPGEMA